MGHEPRVATRAAGTGRSCAAGYALPQASNVLPAAPQALPALQPARHISRGAAAIVAGQPGVGPFYLGPVLGVGGRELLQQQGAVVAHGLWVDLRLEALREGGGEARGRLLPALALK